MPGGSPASGRCTCRRLSAPAVLGSGVYNWNNVTPRVGITYAVDQGRAKPWCVPATRCSRRQLPGRRGEKVRVADSGYSYALLTTPWTAQRRTDHHRSSSDPGPGPDRLSRDSKKNKPEPTRRGCRRSTPSIPTGQERRCTHEFLIGMDKEILPNFSVSGTFTYSQDGGLWILIWWIPPMTGA